MRPPWTGATCRRASSNSPRRKVRSAPSWCRRSSSARRSSPTTGGGTNWRCGSQRFYKPFSLHLVEFKHDRYPGTDIPKNFSSRVRLQRPDTGEDREVLIYMNNPLRYAGETFYQASFDRDDQGTILQVVRNPSWLTPYFSCVLVAPG